MYPNSSTGQPKPETSVNAIGNTDILSIIKNTDFLKIRIKYNLLTT